MRLKAIKLSGFKSFVDPTTVSFATNMTGIVGPNGCGKSNTIDAVRWVMGESSAKYLRGDAMTDVIFNGSTERKPVGKASVELQFDNSDHTLRGEYAAYTDISVRRQVTREGQSQYFLNGSRCRRRDITDLFLGTGLGPRSYAIIEQGMISRLIEAKPDELRVYVEEAAGISRYKDRRRETENRMRRTRENLERLEDIREELSRQLVHLQKQAEAAEKYKALKTEEKTKKAELTALKWQLLDTDFSHNETRVSELATRIEAGVANQTHLESQIEITRLQVVECNDAFQVSQAAFYDIGTHIARQEQKLEHQSQLAQQLEHSLRQVEQALGDNQRALQADEADLQSTRGQLEIVSEDVAILVLQQEEREQYAEQAEERWGHWQESWNQFTDKAGEPARQSESCKVRIQSCQQQLERAHAHQQRRQQELDAIKAEDNETELLILEEEVSELALLLETAQEAFETEKETLSQSRNRLSQGRSSLEQERRHLTQLVQRKATLEALQQAAMAVDDETVGHWLETRQLARYPRLANMLTVDAGWELAVETVLGQRLTAVVVETLEALQPHLGVRAGSALDFWERSPADSNALLVEQPSDSLLAHVRSDVPLDSVLAEVRVAADLEQALAMRKQLEGTESVVLADGTWIGRDWIRVPAAMDSEAGEATGLLQRQQALEQVTEEWDLLDMDVEEKAADLEALQLQIHTREQNQEQLEREVNQRQQAVSESTIKVAHLKAAQGQRYQQRQSLERELQDAAEQQQMLQEELEEARMDEQEALVLLEAFELERSQLQNERAEIQSARDHARTDAGDIQKQCHQEQLRQQQLQSRLEGLEQARSRLLHEQESLRVRQQDVKNSQQQDHHSERDRMQAELHTLLEQRQSAEGELQLRRQALEQVESLLSELGEKRQTAEQAVYAVRTQWEAARMESQALDIRRQTLIEQLSEDGLVLKDVIEHLSDQASVDEWQRELVSLGARIQRLGNINLAAIEECQQQGERKEYLDAQYEDLLTALNTLEGAIVRIDQETRTRFSQTFDEINQGLMDLFPKVFGGGNARLELTGDDLLTTGVAIMARPPGKKNSTIHLLSGGEKALTAIALVFSIFQLNPAPFCMLDEVDAPLDDANVGRYGRLVKAMSDRVQFIYITHNKIAMEMASQLMGVTMQEPGVSRLVSVNVEEAAEMVDE